MDLNFFKEKWDHFKGDVEKNWDKLTKEDLKKIEGDVKKLKDTIIEKYDLTSDEAEKQIKEFGHTILDKTNELKGKVDGSVKDAESKANELKDKTKDSLKNLKDKF